jgi:hypothetical protein
MKKLLIILTIFLYGCVERVVQKVDVNQTYVSDTTYSISKVYKSGKYHHTTNIPITKEEYLFLKEKGNIDVKIKLPKIYVKNTSGGEDIEITQKELNEFKTQHNPKIEYVTY